ncbi:MAG: peptidoglycan DL-endopeptidase CwlO, partial [Solirubrobacteraceae bacterium]|nr:peptidoglycan DL-endopeptidase CwlO [Solirubrobacteraceae bacterium]
MTQPSEATAPAPPAGKLPRTGLLVAAISAVVIAAVVAVVVTAGGSHQRPRGVTTAAAKSRRTGAGAHAPAPVAQRSLAPGQSAATGARANVAETADPQEASSFPAPASVRHKAAATPASAGQEVVAAGAPSDAEVKQELAQMQAVERSAKRQQKLSLAPVPGGESVGGNGTIPIPTNVPEAVQRVVAGANAIADFPYVFGGGHGSFVDNAYDCSGSVSYALAAGGLIGAPETSGELESWGAAGAGRYITVYANAGHTYMYIDGILFDTAGRSGVYA